MSTQFFPLAGCQQLATDVQADMALSKLRLFQAPFAPTASTPRADYIASEADFAGYPAGGATLTAWNDPILSPGSGYQIGSPLVQFAFDSGAGATTNIINGGWIEDAAGIPRMAFIFDNPIPMQQDGQGLPLNVIWPFPTGQ